MLYFPNLYDVISCGTVPFSNLKHMAYFFPRTPGRTVMFSHLAIDNGHRNSEFSH